MKNVLALIITLIGLTSSTQAFCESRSGVFDLDVGAGLRMGKDDNSNKVSKGVIGFRLDHTDLQFAGQNRLSVLAPGVNFQTDGIFTISISPLMVVVPNKIAIGVDWYIPSSNTSAGAFGIFVGIPLF
jgi:hypothetical protein